MLNDGARRERGSDRRQATELGGRQSAGEREAPHQPQRRVRATVCLCQPAGAEDHNDLKQ